MDWAGMAEMAMGAAQKVGRVGMNVATLAGEEVANRAGLNLTDVEKRTWEALSAGWSKLSQLMINCRVLT